MAKAKKQKAPGQFAGTVADEKFYYLPSGLLVKADGTPVEPGQAKRYAPLLEPFVPPQPKEVLEEAFPEAYEEPRTKKRTARKRNEDVEKREAAEKEAADLKRDVEDLRQQLNGISTLMREDTALIKQQLSTQQKSIVLLTEISKHIKGGGGGGPSISGGFGWKGMLAAMLGAGALGAAGGYFLNDMLSDDEEEDDKPDVTAPPPEAPPQQSAAIQQAEQRGEQKSEILTINATQLTFNSDKLRFEVNDLTIDADKINGGPSSGVMGGGGGGGGPNGPTGSAGGGPAAGPAGGAFNPNTETPSSPSGTPGQSIAGGKGAYQGFTGKSPTPETVKEDVEKAGKFTLQTGGGEGAAGGSRSWRNNNPGNIEYGEFAKSVGATSTDGRFAIFPDYETGRKAQEKLLFESKSYKDLTLGQAIARWAPASENNVPAYIKAMGGDTSKRMSEYTPEERAKLLDAMQKQEGWKAGKPAPVKAEIVTTSPAELMPNQSTGDLFNPNPTTSTAASFQPVPFEKAQVVSAGVSSGRGSINETLNERFAYNAVGSGRGAAPPGMEPAREIPLPPTRPGELKRAGSWTPDRTVPYADFDMGGGDRWKSYSNTPAEILGLQRADQSAAIAAANQKPEAPAPTAPSITPEPEVQGPPAPAGGAQLGSYDAINKPTGMGDTKFGIDGPEGNLASFYTRRPHKAFLYLTPDMKIPNLSIGGQ